MRGGHPRGAGCRCRPGQPRRAGGRGQRLPARATRSCVGRLGRERRHRKRARTAAPRAADGRIRLARRLVGARPPHAPRRLGNSRRSPADRARPAERCRTARAQPGCPGVGVRGGAHVRGDDRIVLRRPAVPPTLSRLLRVGSLSGARARRAARRRRGAAGRTARGPPRRTPTRHRGVPRRRRGAVGARNPRGVAAQPRHDRAAGPGRAGAWDVVTHGALLVACAACLLAGIPACTLLRAPSPGRSVGGARRGDPDVKNARSTDAQALGPLAPGHPGSPGGAGR